ncbi:hypothetical protein D3C81_1852790 [compost metagenome]
MQLGAASRQGLGIDLVAVLDIQVQAHACATELLAGGKAALHVAGVAQHQRRVTDPQFGMAHAPTRGIEAEHLDRTKGLLVELDGFGGVVDGQVGGDAVLAFGDGFDCHVRLSFAVGAGGRPVAWSRLRRWKIDNGARSIFYKCGRQKM